MHRYRLKSFLTALATMCVALGCLSGCSGRHSSAPAKVSEKLEARESEDSSSGEGAVSFKLTSSAFKDGEVIPRKYTGEADDISPPLSWDGAPETAKEFALICDDPDAPSAEPWVHWVMYGIAPDVHALPEGLKSDTPQLKEPVAAKQGKNSWPSGVTVGYRGPLPPPGKAHHYRFTLFALQKPLDLAPGATDQELVKAMGGYVLGEAKLVGTYERKP
jgi:Raf kinase inhibitor-like YbhB/YbcL family protein